MDDNKIVITDNNGEENVFEILFTYEDEENGNKYVMYYSEEDDEQIRKKYDIYCFRDSVYKRRHDIEKRLSASDAGELLPEHPVIMAKIISLASFIAMSGLKADATEKDCLAWLRQQKIYICEEV